MKDPQKTDTAQKAFYRSVLMAQNGDVDAFSSLVASTQNLVTSTALAITFDIAASEDVSQATYLDAWRQLKQLKSPDSFLPWLRQITRNKAKNFLRDNQWSRRQQVNDIYEAVDASATSDADVPDLELQLAKRQTEQALMELVAQLPAENRDVLILYYREEQNSAQVAQLLDLSEANVRQKLSRIRSGLKDELVSQLGEYVLSTAPTIAFTALVTTSIGASVPASAAISQAIVSESAAFGGMAKVIALLGGAIIGGITAIAAIFIASKIVQNKLSDEEQKILLKRHTKGQIIWVAISAICLAASYELTEGWMAPVSVYTLFIAGLMMQQIKLAKWFQYGVLCSSNKGYMAGWLGMLIGGVGGFTGLLMGLVNSGRLVI